MPEERWTQLLEINLSSEERINDALLEAGKLNDNGRIVCVSSMSGIAGNSGQTNYAASKAGVIGMVEAMAPELAERQATINAVAPGYIPSRLTDAMSEEARQATLGQIPIGRLGTPEEVAAAVRFLAGEEAGYITGQVLAVDGGMTMGA